MRAARRCIPLHPPITNQPALSQGKKAREIIPASGGSAIPHIPPEKKSASSASSASASDAASTAPEAEPVSTDSSSASPEVVAGAALPLQAPPVDAAEAQSSPRGSRAGVTAPVESEAVAEPMVLQEPEGGQQEPQGGQQEPEVAKAAAGAEHQEQKKPSQSRGAQSSGTRKRRLGTAVGPTPPEEQVSADTEAIAGEAAAPMPPPKRTAVRSAALPESGANSEKKMKFGEELEGGEMAWKPPEGQSGDGRTALNDKLGY